MYHSTLYLPQFIPQSIDFIIFLLQLLLKFSISSVHLFLQQQRIVGYWSIRYQETYVGEHFRELVEKYFYRENFHQLLTGATKRHHALSQIAVKFAKVFSL